MIQYASFLFPAPDLLGLLGHSKVPKVGFRAVSEYMPRQGVAYTAATGYPFPQPTPSHNQFSDTWNEMAKPLEWRPPVSIADAPASGRSWPLQSWARYVQSLSHSSCAGMCTHVPVVVGPNSPLGPATMEHGAAHPRTCG